MEELRITIDRKDFENIEQFLFQLEFNNKPFYDYITLEVNDLGTIYYYYYESREEFGHWYIVTSEEIV